jgi:hypothetical protein
MATIAQPSLSVRVVDATTALAVLDYLVIFSELEQQLPQTGNWLEVIQIFEQDQKRDLFFFSPGAPYLSDTVATDWEGRLVPDYQGGSAGEVFTAKRDQQLAEHEGRDQSWSDLSANASGRWFPWSLRCEPGSARFVSDLVRRDRPADPPNDALYDPDDLPPNGVYAEVFVDEEHPLDDGGTSGLAKVQHHREFRFRRSRDRHPETYYACIRLLPSFGPGIAFTDTVNMHLS